MSNPVHIKLLPFIGIIIGLWLGEETRTGFIMSEISWADLIDGLFNRSPADQRLAKRELIHIGSYGLIGGILGFLFRVSFQKKISKEDR